MELSSPNINKILIFSKKKAFLIYPEMEPCTFQPRLEKEKNLLREKLLILQETFRGFRKKFLFFSKETCSYISENGNLEEDLLNIKKLFIFQETELSYISRKVYSEP